MAEEDMKSGNMANIEYRMPAALILDSIEDLLPKWNKFKQEFQICLRAAGFERLSDARKAAILLNCISQDAQDLFYNVLKSDEDTQTLKYEEVIKKKYAYFQPKQNELISTLKCHNRQQEDYETFDCFYSEIRKLSKNVNFETYGDRMLRDRIVMGIKDKKLQCKLLEVQDMTLDKAVTMCRAAELSGEHNKVLQKQPDSLVSVDSLQQQNNKDKYNYIKKSSQKNNK